MTSSSNIVPFPPSDTIYWIEEYQQARLAERDPGTVRVYRHTLQQFLQWVSKHAGQVNRFSPEQITSSVVGQYLQELASQGYSLSHRKRARSVLAQFCQWLIEDKALLQRNPTRGLVIAPPAHSQPSVPRILTPTQRSILLDLMHQEDRRGKALFALGYWAGCRVTDIVDLRIGDTHVGPKSGWLHVGGVGPKSGWLHVGGVGPKSGWLHVGGEGTKARDIDLSNEARRLLYDYVQHRSRDEGSPFLFVSQRSARLTDAGLHHWFRALKRQAAPSDEKLIADIAFHDLRHDFAHRALEAGWTLEEVAYYLGQLTTKGLPATQTTLRYTQMTRAQVKEKLKLFKS
jgi:site-specific recombinase XerD